MLNSFITFIVYSNSLDDRDLLLTVDSIRQQNEFNWVLEVRVPILPNISAIEDFTHDNPRVKVVDAQSNSILTITPSLVFSVIPKGIQLLTNACFEIARAFEFSNADVVVVNTICSSYEANTINQELDRICPLVLVIRCHGYLNDPLSLIDIPMQQSRSHSTMPNTKKSQQTRLEYINDLEIEVRVLRTQLQVFIDRPDELKIMEHRLAVTQTELAQLKEQINTIKTSRTWKIGRAIIRPAHAVTHWWR
jgi:hypothetical protein